LSAINFQCKSLQQSDFSQSFLVQKMLEGLKRLKKPSDSRLPITEELLDRIICNLPNVCTSFYEADLFSSAFSVAFHGLLRVGEIVLSKSWQKHQVIGIEHVRFGVASNRQEIVRITIPFSKTDQYGYAATVEIKENKSSICPVYLLKKYMSQRTKLNGPLFCHYSGKPVTRYQFSSVLNKALTFMGIGNLMIRSHSFRIGAASSHFEKGISEAEIKKLGRWKSNTYKGYIRT
jgi:hypothetical protein